MNSIGRTSLMPGRLSSKVSIALLLNVTILAVAGFALYRFRQAWLISKSKVFLPVTIAGSSVGIVALTALNYAIWRSKRVIEAPLPVPPEQPDPFKSLPTEIVLKIFKHLSPEDLALVMRVDRQFYSVGMDPLFWRPLLSRAWVGQCPIWLDQGGCTVYQNFCKLQLLIKQGRLQEIVRATSFQGHAEWVSSIAAQPDGRIISGSFDRTVRVWNMTSGQELACFIGHTAVISSVAAHPDGRIFSGSWDDTIRVWDTESGQQLACFEVHTGGVDSLVVAPDGEKIIFGSNDFSIRVLKIETGHEVVCLRGHTGSINSIAAYPDGRIISGSADQTVRVWDMTNGQELACFQGNAGVINSVAIAPSGEIIFGSADGTVRVLDSTSGQELTCLRGHTGSVNSIAVYPDGRIISGSGDRTVRVWDMTSGQELACLRGHGQGVTGVAIAPSGAIISASYGNIFMAQAYDAGRFE